MIIVSQDKGKIINFDNMTRVYITFDEGDDDVCIRTETVDSLYEDLGYYKTEERAKEVLQEIVKNNSIFNYFKCVNSEVQETMAGSFIRADFMFDVYEMPEK
jgi:hypothetical protein